MTEESLAYRLGRLFGSRNRQRRMKFGATNAAYARALEEIESGSTDKGLWAKALTDSDGDTVRTKATYIRLRQQERDCIAGSFD